MAGSWHLCFLNREDAFDETRPYCHNWKNLVRNPTVYFRYYSSVVFQAEYLGLKGKIDLPRDPVQPGLGETWKNLSLMI